MPRFPGFIGGSFPTQSASADQQRTVNLYVERMQSGSAANDAVLLPSPGFSRVAQFGDVSARGMCFAGSRLFAIWGAGLYEVAADYTVTRRGTVAQDSYPATINYGGLASGVLWIVSGTNGYTYDLTTNTLTQILTGECTMGGFVHEYFLSFNAVTGRVRVSALNDAATWPALAFFQRSLYADPWVAMVVDANSLIWMIGTETFEVWYDTGAIPQPFAPLSGLVGRFGILAPFAWGLAGNALIWAARTTEGQGQVVQAQGGIPQPVSTYALEHVISQYARTSRIDDAEMLVYRDEGHTFACLSFPTANATWCYDVAQPSWTERGKWNPVRGDYDAWAPRVHALAWGKHFTGDRTSSYLAQMASSLSTELDGTGVRWLRRAPGLVREHARIPYDRLELLMDVGVGLAGTGQGSDPQIMLRCSDDGGRTWGAQRQAGIGRLGEYKRRVYWNRLGTSAYRVFEVSGSDPVPFRLTDAWLNPTEAAA